LQIPTIELWRPLSACNNFKQVIPTHDGHFGFTGKLLLWPANAPRFLGHKNLTVLVQS